MVLLFSLLPLISYLDKNKHKQYGRIHQLGFIRAISWSAQNAESHWPHVHIIRIVEVFNFHAFYKNVGYSAI